MQHSLEVHGEERMRTQMLCFPLNDILTVVTSNWHDDELIRPESIKQFGVGRGGREGQTARVGYWSMCFVPAFKLFTMSFVCNVVCLEFGFTGKLQHECEADIRDLRDIYTRVDLISNGLKNDHAEAVMYL